MHTIRPRGREACRLRFVLLTVFVRLGAFLPLSRVAMSVTLRKLLLISASLLSPLAMADTGADEFAGCLAGLGERALHEGISPATVRTALAPVAFEQRVLDADRRQPEFADTFANYLGRRVTDGRIERGRELLEAHEELLNRIAAEYGIAPAYLISFWGLETNFGSYFGTIPVLNSLATLACDPRRADYFTAELLNALRIVDRGDVQPARMVGSWAGAMGHTQFMPSVYLRYAIDGDGDGRVDLWGSAADALTSAANFLRGIGWRAGERWGREVLVPTGFDYRLAGRDQTHTLAEWQALGVRRTDGEPLSGDLQAASLLVPAGHQGPAFLIYDNFDTIMRWNRSEYYAIAVGHLADRIAGAAPLHRPPPADAPRLSRDQVAAMQHRLSERGFDSGTADGIFGPATRAAIRQLQQAQGWIADGYPDKKVLAVLEIVTAES